MFSRRIKGRRERKINELLQMKGGEMRNNKLAPETEEYATKEEEERSEMNRIRKE